HPSHALLFMPNPQRTTLLPYPTLFRSMARAHCKEGEFPGERHEALQDEMELGKLGFSFHNVVCGAQDPLPLAVIAHPASLEHGRSEEHKSELQSPAYLVYLLLLDQKHI